MPNLGRRPTFLVHQLNAELARICNPMFRSLGVDLITSRILVIVLERGETYVGDVVDVMALPQSTVSHQIKRLEAGGFLKRRTDTQDNRAVLLTLTRRGRRVAEQCDAVSQSIYAELFADMPAREVENLVTQLQHINDRLRAMTSRDSQQAPSLEVAQ